MADDSYETSSLICLSSLICAFQNATKFKHVIFCKFSVVLSGIKKEVYLDTAEQR